MTSFGMLCLLIQEVLCSVFGEINLALRKPASQSNTSFGSLGQASNAVDGNKDGNFYAGSCTYALDVGSSVGWWMVDLQGIYTIRSVRITNRSDCCNELLHSFVIEISTENPTLLRGFPKRTTAADCRFVRYSLPYNFPYPIDCEEPLLGRFIRIVKLAWFERRTLLSICEFEAFEITLEIKDTPPSSPDIAFKKPSQQSSVASLNGSSGASRANDGSRDAPVLTHNCARTAKGVVHWWVVDLQASYTIGTIRIRNRIECCSEDLADFVVEVSEEDPSTLAGFPGRTVAPVCVTVIEPVPIPFAVNYECDKPVTGRYVRIVKGGEPLTLCGVEVYEEDPLRERVPEVQEITTTVKPPQEAETINKSEDVKKGMLVFVHVTSHGFQHTHTSVTEQRYLTDCARQRLEDKKNRMVAPYIQIDLPVGTCRFLKNMADSKTSTSSKWTVYELVYL